jgi:hypothetical protein
MRPASLGRRQRPVALVAVMGLLVGLVSAAPDPAGAAPVRADQVFIGVAGSSIRAVQTRPGPGWSIQDTHNAQEANGMLSADSCAGLRFCMAVGSFADRLSSSALAQVWNGKAWSLLTVPTPPGSSGSAFDGVSCSSASACVAVGDHLDASGVHVTLAEGWNGTSWSVQSTADPVGAASSVMQSVSCLSPTWCEAVGYFVHTNRGRVRERFAEMWNGVSWTLQKTANPVDDASSVLDGLSCTAIDSCIAVGYYLDSDRWVTLAEDWNGDAWSVLVTPNPTRSILASLYGVSCSSATSCTAVGDAVYSSRKLLAATLAEAWNGETWTIQSTPNRVGMVDIDTLESVVCSSARSCLAVGYCTHLVGAGASTLAESWNGSTWTIQTTPSPGRSFSSLSGVSCNSTKACRAVGDYRNPTGTYLSLSEVSNSVTWSVQANPLPTGVVSSDLASVSCSSPTACVAVGSYANSSSTKIPLAEEWDGTAWNVQSIADPTGARHNVLESVSCSSPTACTAVGQSDNKNGTVTLAEGWNGSDWTIQTTPNPSGKGAELSRVSCSSATACTAVGYYLTDSDLSETLAEVWNGTVWAIQAMPNPSGNDSPVLQGVSCSSSAACTAVGNYTSDGALVALAERWDGTAWTIQSTPAGDDDLYGVSCSSATACTAVGDSYGYPSGIAPLVEAWNGKTWNIQQAVDPVSYFSSFYGVSCRSATLCTAVGGYDNSSGTAETLAESWNGTHWKIQITPNPRGRTNSVLSDVSDSSASALIAVGSDRNRAGVVLTLGETGHD